MRVDQLREAGRVEVTWLPFELHPEVPREGMPRERLFSSERSARMREHVDAMAREVGLVMRQPERLINTRLALATAEFARDRGRFEEVHRALFRAHWEGTAQLDRIEDLRRIASEHALDADELGAALEVGRYEPLLDRHRDEATAAGIDAIPAHIVGRRYLLVGAQPLSVFEQVLERAATEEGAGEERTT